MKQMLRYALSAVVCFGVVAPVLGQQGRSVPADVPETHWAYESLRNLFERGLLRGYPDGLFRGPRPASRYELAVAIHNLYQYLMGLHNSQQRQIDQVIADLERLRGQSGTGDMDSFATKADLARLQDQLAQLRNQMEQANQLRGEVDTLKRMASTFERELARMGVDVEQMKRDFGALSGRVDELEKRLNVAISGSVDFFIVSGAGKENSSAIMVDGRRPGVVAGDTPSNTGYVRSITAFHEAAITLKGTNTEGPQWTGTFVVGNFLGMPQFQQQGLFTEGFGTQAFSTPGAGFQEGASDLYIQDLNITFDAGVLGNSMSAKVGRMGYKVSPYIFQRPDTTPYFSNERWDNGEWMVTGGLLGFNFGAATLDVLVGRTSGQLSTNGVEIQPMFAGQLGSALAGNMRPIGNHPFFRNNAALVPVDRVLGANIRVPFSNSGQLNLAYLMLTSNTRLFDGGVNTINGVDVLGADLDLKLGALDLNAGYAKSTTVQNNRRKFDRDNQAFHVKLGYNSDRFGLYAGARRIEPNFGAPGDWGRVGMWWNPTDHEGFMVGGHLNVSNDIILSGSGEFYRGLDKVTTVPTGPNTTMQVGGLGKDDKLNSYKADLKWHFSSNWHLMLGYERVEWRPGGINAKPYEQWASAGVGLRLSDNARFSLTYHDASVRTAGLAYFNPFPGEDRARGAFITSQLSAKF